MVRTFIPSTFILSIVLAILALCPAGARADVLAHIDISEQRLHLYVDGEKKDSWKVSTGLRKGWTNTGTFRPQFLSRHHRSRLFRGAPMPYSVFYDSHWAIHGTTAIQRLGRPASHGCVRLHPKHAAVLFNLVVAQGKANTVVWITD
ncbi:MAG: L,D-transpeptidase [Methyloligellaceae bacterium]